MRIFLDANVLISVINKEYPLFTYSSRILSLAGHTKFEVFTSPVCLAITFYFAEKKHRTKLARQKIGLLSENIAVAGVMESAVSKTVNNPAINDFEDGLEYYAARESNCQCIITEDVADFYFSEIEVLTCEVFLKKYLAGK
jgi:predicted nucleic acid-binding protein